MRSSNQMSQWWRAATEIGYTPVEDATAVRAAAMLPTIQCDPAATSPAPSHAQAACDAAGSGVCRQMAYAVHHEVVLAVMALAEHDADADVDAAPVSLQERSRWQATSRVDGLLALPVSMAADGQREDCCGLLLAVCSDGSCVLLEVTDLGVMRPLCAEGIDETAMMLRAQAQLGGMDASGFARSSSGRVPRSNGCLIGGVYRFDNCDTTDRVYVPVHMYEGVISVLEIAAPFLPRDHRPTRANVNSSKAGMDEAATSADVSSPMTKPVCTPAAVGPRIDNVHDVDLESTMSKMRLSETQQRSDATTGSIGNLGYQPMQSISTIIVSSCFAFSSASGGQGGPEKGLALVLLTCEESYSRTDMTCFCFTLDVGSIRGGSHWGSDGNAFGLSDALWSLRNLHPTTRIVLGVRGGVAVASQQGLLLIADSNSVEEIRILMDGVPMVAAVIGDDDVGGPCAPDRMGHLVMLGDSTGSIYFVDVRRGLVLRKLAPACSIGTLTDISIASVLLCVHGHPLEAMSEAVDGLRERILHVFVGSSRGNSVVMRVNIGASDAEAERDVAGIPIGAGGGEREHATRLSSLGAGLPPGRGDPPCVILPSLSPIHLCTTFEEPEGSGERHLAMICGSGPSTSLCIAHKGVSLCVHAVAEGPCGGGGGGGDSLRSGRPRLMTFNAATAGSDPLVLFSYDVTNETRALVCEGDVFRNADIAGLDHDNVTLATGCAPSDGMALQVTRGGIRLLRSEPVWGIAGEWKPDGTTEHVDIAAADERGRVVVGCGESIHAFAVKDGALLRVGSCSLGNQVSAIGLPEGPFAPRGNTMAIDCVGVGMWLQNSVRILQWPSMRTLREVGPFDSQPRSIVIIPRERKDAKGDAMVRDDDGSECVAVAVGTAEGWVRWFEITLSRSGYSRDSVSAHVGSSQFVRVASSAVNLQVIDHSAIRMSDSVYGGSLGEDGAQPDEVMIYANSDRDALFSLSRLGEIDVQRVAGESRTSITQFRRPGVPPPSPAPVFHGQQRPTLMWLSEDGTFSVGCIDRDTKLQHRRIHVATRGLRTLDYMRSVKAFILCGSEGGRDILHVVHATTCRVLVSMELEKLHRITAALILRVDEQTELLVVASSRAEGALGAAMVSVFRVVRVKDDEGVGAKGVGGGDDAMPSSPERWALELHGSTDLPCIVSCMAEMENDRCTTASKDSSKQKKSFRIVCGCPLKPQIRLYDLHVDLDLLGIRSCLSQSAEALSKVDGDMESARALLGPSTAPTVMTLLCTTSTPHGGSAVSVACVGETVFVTEFMGGVSVVVLINEGSPVSDQGDAATEHVGDDFVAPMGVSDRPEASPVHDVRLRVVAVDNLSSPVRSLLPVDGGDCALASLRDGSLVLLGRNSDEEAACLERYRAEQLRSFEAGQRQQQGGHSGAADSENVGAFSEMYARDWGAGVADADSNFGDHDHGSPQSPLSFSVGHLAKLPVLLSKSATSEVISCMCHGRLGMRMRGDMENGTGTGTGAPLSSTDPARALPHNADDDDNTRENAFVISVSNLGSVGTMEPGGLKPREATDQEDVNMHDCEAA